MSPFRFTLLFFLISFFIKSVTLNAQTEIIGSLTDPEGQALAFANVLLLQSADSLLVKGSVTREDGSFSIPDVIKGSYLIKASMVGYQDALTPLFDITGNDPRFDKGEIRLGAVAEELSEIEVVAKKPLFEQKIDRTVVNVQSSITSAGGTALEVLEKSPGIIVNRQSGAISMAGKDGVIVMINGKENRMPVDALVKLLDGMNASNIEQIELITTPPARYDAEGDAGIINIIMTKSTDNGINGNYTLNAGYGEKEKFGGSLNFNARAKKLNVYGDFAYSRNHTYQIFSNLRTVNFDGVETFTSGISERDPFTDVYNGRLGIDIELSEKTILGAIISGYDSKWDMEAFNEIKVFEDGDLVESQGIFNTEINHWKHIMGNLNLEHRINKKNVLNFDVDYLHYHDRNPTEYFIDTYDENGTVTNSEETFSGKVTPIHVWVGRVDFTKDFSEKLKMESGVKGTLSRFTNDVDVSALQNGVWVPDTDLSQKYKLKEEIAAVYNSLTLQLSDKTGMSIGLRFEYTLSNLGTIEQADIVDRKYGYLFPSFFVSHQINDNNGINFSYSRRISRPTYNDLAPFVIFLDPSTFFSGNAALQPSITDSFKSEYRFKSFLVSLQYSYDQDPIARFQPRVDQEENKQFITADNLDNRHTVNLSLTIPVTITKWWDVRINSSATWQQTTGEYLGEKITQDQKTIGLNGSMNFSLPKSFSMEFSGFYRTPALFGIVETNPLGLMSFGVQKKFEKGSTLRFNIQDIFDTMKFSGIGNLPEQGLNTRTTYDVEGQIFRLSFSAPFGNKKIKGKRNRETGSEEERRRVE